MILTGCSKDVVKNIRIIDLESEDYTLQEDMDLSTRDINSVYRIELNGVSDTILFGSILNTEENGNFSQTEDLFSYCEGEFTHYSYEKKKRIIDYTVVKENLYYLEYNITDNILKTELYQYVDGVHDVLIQGFQGDADDFYNPASIFEYKDGFILINNHSDYIEIYKFSDGELKKICERKKADEVVPLSLSQINKDTLYMLSSKEQGSSIIKIDLDTGDEVSYPFGFTFGRFTVLDDYIVIYDEEHKKELVYNKERENLWTSDLNAEIVRWVMPAGGNKAVYTDNYTDDIYIRDYDTDTCYRILGKNEDFLKQSSVKFDICDNTIFMTGHYTLFSIQIPDVLNHDK